MTSEALTLHFGVSLGRLMAPCSADLTARLSLIDGLGAAEREAISAGHRNALVAQLHRKLARVLLVELNRMRVKGRLKGASPEDRWAYFLHLSQRQAFWEALWIAYPSLKARIDTLIANSVASAVEFAQRWAADRDDLGNLLGAPVGALTALHFGKGDTHQGGRTVAMVTCQGGTLVYKPRPVAIDAALVAFLAELEAACGEHLWMRVPVVDVGERYGWAQFVEHRYADDVSDLTRFYRGIGQWLAVLRLLGGVDVHAENLIACGAYPVIVDCETLFAPRLPGHPSGFGDALDRANHYVAGTVFATGLLPSRARGLGWRGADVSGIGALPDQQPLMMVPDIVAAGTDVARIAMVPAEPRRTQNHPSAAPSLVDHWPEILAGFSSLSASLRRLDEDGRLRALLTRFEACRVRVVLRATEPYAELARMLWHPVSLHNEPAAVTRAHDLLAAMAENVPMAPSAPEVIAAEIDALLVGDIPYFSTQASVGRLDGPGNCQWLDCGNLVEDALARWRAADLASEKAYMRAALFSAYLAEDLIPPREPVRPALNRIGDLDIRRRRQAAKAMERLISSVIRGNDGTVTWIAPILLTTGWTVQALNDDLYNGLSGLAVLSAAYLRETAAGRADPVSGIEALLSGILKSIDAFAARNAAIRAKQDVKKRPPPPGAYLGLGSQIWSRLLLLELGVRPDGLGEAMALREEIPAAVTADTINDLLKGCAGAIPALLALYSKTKDPKILAMADDIGAVLAARAKWEGPYAWWTYVNWPEGLGGFAHGVTGIGWALMKLADATGKDAYRHLAGAAFAFEDRLFDEAESNWVDMRQIPGSAKAAAAWCHGAVGIGLARLDLDPGLKREWTRRSLQAAVKATWTKGWGWNHGLCHGDTGAWELLDRAIDAGEGPNGLSREDLLAALLTGIEDAGIVTGVTNDAFVPGLFTGAGGVAYQLLRANPAAGLPSVLLPGQLLSTVRGASAHHDMVSA